VRSLQATITLEYKDEKIAKAIAQAVTPDNFKTPIGLHVKTERHENKVITQIECEGKLDTFTATIDDLLFSVSIAEKTLKTIK
jgi:tRNA threonylcarbamoyladenosine modification (KEOPS) complex  Pcc1 subunit